MMGMAANVLFLIFFSFQKLIARVVVDPTWSEYTTQNQVRSLLIASTSVISDVL